MYSVIKSILSARKKSESKDSEYRMIDSLLSLQLDEAKAAADCMTLLVASFHTSALCEYLTLFSIWGHGKAYVDLSLSFVNSISSCILLYLPNLIISSQIFVSLDLY